ncbi:MAG: sigma-70 family RNA polymerase sigma factor [Alphaproteobacteria bacterium]|nr:sigma-70 family RNA polymerase sigma factor [Alphaproteobacteria bacterium]
MTDSRDELRRGITGLLPRLRRFGAVLSGSQDEGDDLVQAAIERALSKNEQWQSGTRIDSWLFKIMQNNWKDEIRKRKNVQKKLVLDSAGTDQSVDGRRVTETMLMLTKTREQFTRLSDEHRAVLALVVIDGHSYQEAADQLEIPIGTLMSRLYRAREALRQMVEQTNSQATAEINKRIGT